MSFFLYTETGSPGHDILTETRSPYMRKIDFINGEYYHVYNRGIEKRDIFLDGRDYSRFVHDLFEFNDSNPALDYRLLQKLRGGIVSPAERKQYVDILSWCLMPNHFHFLVRQCVNRGVSDFLQKIGTGFTTYFNKRYERDGRLFQGPFKARHIDNDSYLLHISRYIHLNPLDLFQPNWKDDGIQDWYSTHQSLEQYRWSSYRDWVGIKNFPSVMNLSLRTGLFKDEVDYKQFIQEWVLEEEEKIQPFILD